MPQALPPLAVIGGSGLYSLNDGAAAEVAEAHRIDTPYADEPVTVYREVVREAPVWFIPRHGKSHAIAPHQINYRANLWALREAGARRVIAVNAVGGITTPMGPGRLVVPDQIIDYTWGREHTYFDGPGSLHRHIDFSFPYDRALGRALAAACRELDHQVNEGAVYACTQGPRLETAAEVTRLRHDGCDIVGMTGMPEAALARELGLDYGCIALVVNWAAGVSEKVITLGEIEAVLSVGIADIRKVLRVAVEKLSGRGG